MNCGRIFSLSILCLMQAFWLMAQEPKSTTEDTLRLGFIQKIEKEALKRGVQVDENALLSLFKKDVCANEFAMSDPSRSYLHNYFIARAEAIQSAHLAEGVIADFSCAYISNAYGFVPARLQANEPVTLISAETQGAKVEFVPATAIKDGIVLLPSNGYREGYATVTAAAKSGRTLVWTGPLMYESINFAASGTSKGCEVYVKSKPEKAEVYFNNNLWYEATNTSSVRDPGTLEVKISLKGYEDWVQKRSLGAGETWSIEAHLKKRKTGGAQPQTPP